MIDIFETALWLGGTALVIYAYVRFKVAMGWKI